MGRKGLSHKVPNKTGENNQGKQGGGHAGRRARTLGDVGTCLSLRGGLVMGRLPTGLAHRISRLLTVSGEKGREVESCVSKYRGLYRELGNLVGLENGCRRIEGWKAAPGRA